MYIKNIRLKNFRNYEDLYLDFNKKLNLILGNNAQGKTNLLESIYVCSLGRSFRTKNNSDMVNFNQDNCNIYCETLKDEIEENVEINIFKDSKKTAKINNINVRKASELLNNIHIVIFSPEDLKIVKEEPEKRRKFINSELSQIRTSYYDNLSNYKKVLFQRNSYLKEDVIDKDLMDIWDSELSSYGAKLMKQRNEFIKELDKISAQIYEDITNGKEKLKLKYVPNIEYEEDISIQKNNIYEVLKKSYNTDLKMRTTTKGPHKDDIEFFIDNINVRYFGSQGQQRTTALSLKLAELNIIKKETGEDAILLLDDVMSELDYERQEFLIKSLYQNQLFITTTDIPDMILKKFSEGSIFKVNNGKVKYEEYYACHENKKEEEK